MFRYNKNITYTVETIDVEKEEVKFIGQKNQSLLLQNKLIKYVFIKMGNK
ncbi:hypothetical protein [Clostridium botulinum]|nr:hypothetical protein [Clostridium botulinum]